MDQQPKKIDRKILVIILLTFSICLYFIIIKFNQNNSAKNIFGIASNEEKIPEVSAEEVDVEDIASFTETELVYAKQYKTDPFTKHIRTAINGYLDRTNIGAEWESTRTGGDNTNCGMAKFESYLTSKFVVLSTEEAEYGGKTMIIVFIDKPDKVFSVWVYDLGKGALGYDLRSFCDRGGSENATKVLLKSFSNLINDKSNEI